MSPGSDHGQNQSLLPDKINQQPIRVDMTFPKTLQIAAQRMITAFFRQRSFCKKHINYIPQILQIFAGLCHAFAIFFELRGCLKSETHKSRSFLSSSTEE